MMDILFLLTILAFFAARNRDKILTHTHDTACLRVYVNQLRQKLEADPGRPALIITEPGVGYRLRSGNDR